MLRKNLNLIFVSRRPPHIIFINKATNPSSSKNIKFVMEETQNEPYGIIWASAFHHIPLTVLQPSHYMEVSYHHSRAHRAQYCMLWQERNILQKNPGDLRNRSIVHWDLSQFLHSILHFKSSWKQLWCSGSGWRFAMIMPLEKSA